MNKKFAIALALIAFLLASLACSITPRNSLPEPVYVAPIQLTAVSPQQPAPTEAPVVPQSQPLSSSYPLAGQEYESPQGSSYNAIWTADGRLWQPQLPTGALRIAHTVAFTIEESSYAFDGVECQLFVDSSRNGAGASNPVSAAFGNDLHFTVKTADSGQAWALVQCRGNASSGFQIRWLGK